MMITVIWWCSQCWFCCDCIPGNCLYYKLTGFTKTSSSLADVKLTVSGTTPGSFNTGHSVLCSIFSVSSIFQYSCHWLFLSHYFLAGSTYTAYVHALMCYCCSWYRKTSDRSPVLHKRRVPTFIFKVICTDRNQVSATSWVPDTGRGKSCLA